MPNIHEVGTLFRAFGALGPEVPGFLARAVAHKGGPERKNLFQIGVYDYYFQQLGLSPREVTKSGVGKIVMETQRYWFWADSYLDSLPQGVTPQFEGEFVHRRIAHSQRLQALQAAIEESRLSEEAQEKVRTLISNFKEAAITSHLDFIKRCEPSSATYEEVWDYREKTTGEMAEMFVRIAALAVGADERKTSKVVCLARTEALGLQMMDDLIDSVIDYGRTTNLFNALLREKPEEKEQFSWAISDKGTLSSLRPFQIAEKFSPQTLVNYQKRFINLTDELPPRRRAFARRLMRILSPLLSYTPQAGEKIDLEQATTKGTRR